MLVLTDRSAWIFDCGFTLAAEGRRIALLQLDAGYVDDRLTNTLLVRTHRAGHDYNEWHRLDGCCATAERSLRKRPAPGVDVDAELLELLQAPWPQRVHGVRELCRLHWPPTEETHLEYFELCSQVARIDRQLKVSGYRSSDLRFTASAHGQFSMQIDAEERLAGGEPCQLTPYDTVRFTLIEEGQAERRKPPQRGATAEICEVTPRGLLTLRLLGSELKPWLRYDVSYHISTYVYDIEVDAARWLEECGVVRPVLFPRVEDVPLVSRGVYYGSQWGLGWSNSNLTSVCLVD